MVMLVSFLRSFKQWQSEEQEKGFKAMQGYLLKLGRLTDNNSIWAAFAFLIQKDHEAQQWFVNFVGDHVKRLEDEIMKLAGKVEEASKTATPAEPAVDPKAFADLVAAHGGSQKTIETLKEQLASVKKSVAKLKA